MSFKMIRLRDLMPLREAEGDEEEAGGGNPFAAAGGDEGGGEEGGEEAAAEEPAADDAAAEEGGEEETDAAKPKADLKYPVKFNIGKVKKYNNADFISGEGELKSINSKGMVVTVQPDNVDVFVNFSDIVD